ncbi:MAG: 16S rRNA (guanine(966)-N(2))-methyltransferase RsmD [Chloroflexota bacterium]
MDQSLRFVHSLAISMRVISGFARGTRLKKVPGDSTRPIMDRVKENLFNIIGLFVRDTRWLDLFAGTGQVGIEALSRGAAEVVFTDNVRAAIRTIHANLKTTRLADKAKVVQVDAFAFLRGRQERPFDLIYIAPPQYKEMWLDALKIVDQDAKRLLTDEGMVVVQIDPKEYEEASLTSLSLTDQRRYGNTMLCFYEANVS